MNAYLQIYIILYFLIRASLGEKLKFGLDVDAQKTMTCNFWYPVQISNSSVLIKRVILWLFLKND